MASEYLDCEIYLSDESHARLSVAGREHSGRVRLDEALRHRLRKAALDPNDYGTLLFDALFRGAGDDLLAGYHEALTLARRDHRRLRLRLHLAASAPAELHGLDWELLYDSQQRLAFGRSQEMAFSRYLSVPLEAPPAVEERPKLLVVIAAPDDLADYGLPELDRCAIGEAVERALRPLAGLVSCELLGPPVTAGRLRDRLRAGGVHGLHVVAHGCVPAHTPFDGGRLGNGRESVPGQRLRSPAAHEESAVARLVMEGDDRKALFVDEHLLAEIVEGDRDLRLINLIACHSGTVSGTDPFRGLGPALVRRGVPAVVAMQRAIRVEAAALFTEHFFRDLARYGRIDAAVNEARQQLYLAAPGNREWATPALYLRLREGRLWKAGRGRVPAPLEETGPRLLGNDPAGQGDGTGAVMLIAAHSPSGVETAEAAGPEIGDRTRTEAEKRPVVLRSWSPPELPAEPYPVLLPYTHPALLAGRDQEIDELRHLVRMPVPILGLCAPSGAGKSSLLVGGLVPALRAAPHSPSGATPVALVRHPHEPGIAGRLLGDLLEQSPPVADDDWRGFVERLSEVEALAGQPPLLVLDQFEDVLRPRSADPDTTSARAVLGVLLAATLRRRPGSDEPRCRWLLAYRQEFHGALIAWLGDVLYDAQTAGVDAIDALPHDLSGPERFHSMPLRLVATPPPGRDALCEATRVFREAIGKPLELIRADGTPRYPWHFAPGHAERLARAFAVTRLARPEAPLTPELQVVLAHLLGRAGPDGLVEVPDDPGNLIAAALEDHLRRALETAFPSGIRDTEQTAARTGRARALLALRELATSIGRREEGLTAEDLARAIGEDGEAILEKLATPLTRLVVLREAPDGFRYVLSHDRMAEIVVCLVEEEGQHGKLLVDAQLLALRRFVALKTALHVAREENATRISRRQARMIAAHAEALLGDDDRRAWWTACRKRRRADLRRAMAWGTVALVFLVLLTWGTWSWVRERQQRQALLDQVAKGDPDAALRALDQLTRDPEAPGDALLARLRGREVPMDVLERGLEGIPEEDRSTVVLRTVEIALPWVAENPEDPVLIANLAWALDYGPGRDPSSAAAAQALRDRVLEPLRRLRPPPPIAPDDPDWIEVPSGTFLMGSPEGKGPANEHPRHEVTVSAFRMLRHEVTNAEYRLLVPDHQGEGERPAANMTWYEAYTWAAWLGGRLPTEAEWEYAARAGCPHAYCARDGWEVTVDDVARNLRNSRDPATGEPEPSPVMRLEPNPWGLYDILGNLWEWTTDWYAEYPTGPLPAGPEHDRWGPAAASSGWRVGRGGSFRLRADWVRVALRFGNAPGNGVRVLGFRVLLPGRPELLVVDH